MKAKHYLRVYIANDDPEESNQYKQLIEGEYPNADIRQYDDLAKCINGMYSPDILLIDVSLVAPAMLDDFQHAYRPIAFYSKQYPACRILIKSATGRMSVMTVVDEVNERTRLESGENKAVYGGWGDWDTVKREIDKLIEEKGITK